MDAFVAIFPEVVAARRTAGMDVESAWIDEANNRFVWVVSGPDDFDAAVERYLRSPERRSIRPEPADLIDEMDTPMVRRVL